MSVVNKNENNYLGSIVANGWICTSCKKVHIAVEVNAGHTEEVTRCQKENCGGYARSANYPKVPVSRNKELAKAADYEWYRPDSVEDPKELAALEGGLLKLRERTAAKPITYRYYRSWLASVNSNGWSTLEAHIAVEKQIVIDSNSVQSLYL